MDWKIKDFIAETKAPLRRGYGKIMAVSFLMLVLSVGLSYSSLIDSLNELPELVRNVIEYDFSEGSRLDSHALAVILTLTGGVLILSMLIRIFTDIFLENPLEVGAKKMFLSAMNPDEKVMLSSLAFAYDSDYLNSVKVLFLKRLFRDLWMLLLVVPGVIKTYEYMMIPYLLSEDPYMEHKEAFAISRRMMNGYKKKAFMIQLYFIPWHLLGILTLGIVEIIYVLPKQNMVEAAFYLKVKEQYEMNEGVNE